MVAGGSHNNLGGGPAFASAELYDRETGTWRATGSMTTGREVHTATRLLDGRVLVVGGYGGGSWIASAELYDPITGKWNATGSMTSSRLAHTATLLADGTVLVVGAAVDDSGAFLDGVGDAELYDPPTGAWTTAGQTTEGRKNHSATRLADGRVLVAGMEAAELYDPSTKTWSPAGSPAYEADGLPIATLLDDGRVLILDPGVALLYDPSDGTWSAPASMITPAPGIFSATLLADGRVLVAGGEVNNGSDLLASAVLYEPGSGP